ncbi:MAG: hypothetical protein BRD51_03870, partial [Bacteroidetes bacterium SW_11_64_17]
TSKRVRVYAVERCPYACFRVRRKEHVRVYCRVDASFNRDTVGGLATEMVPHIWDSFAQQAACNLHMTVLHGHNAHHKIEALFKAAARALRSAVRRRAEHAEVASTKGTLS